MATDLVVPPVDPVTVLKNAKALVPQLGTIRLQPGVVIGLAVLAQTNPQVMRDKLAARTKAPPESEERLNKVLKYEDGKQCVVRQLRSPQFLLDTMFRLVGVAIAPQVSGKDDFLSRNTESPIIICMKNKLLSQSSSRKRRTGSFNKRPSRKGRKQIDW